jgi:hypothetical protein
MRDWHITQLTQEAAEKHDRMVHGVPPATMLGWKPYTYRATYRAVSQFACHTEVELSRGLRQRGLSVSGWSPWSNGVRSTYAEEL